MIEVPSPIDQNGLSDWAELSCIFEEDGTLSRSEILKTLEDEQIENAEERTSDIWLEVDRRSHLLSAKYPIEVRGGRLRNRSPVTVPLEYAFPLLLSTSAWYRSTTIKKREWTSTAKLFEEYTTLALGNYLSGKTINIGWPRINGLPSNFKKIIASVCEQLGEPKGRCDLIKKNSKDEGADIIAWLPFVDDRPSQIILLVQCAAGKDFDEKISEPSIKLWRNFIDWQVPAQPAFAFPFMCANSLKWKRLSGTNESILFDRLRLVSLCVLNDNTSIKDKVSNWVVQQASRLPRISS